MIGLSCIAAQGALVVEGKLFIVSLLAADFQYLLPALLLKKTGVCHAVSYFMQKAIQIK